MSAAATNTDLETELERFKDALDVPPGLSLRLRRLVDAIHVGLFDPGLNVGELRRRCRLSDHNVSSEFRHVVGVTIKEYIDSLRLAAVDHLRDRGVPIAKSARCVGFGHAQTYYRARSRRESATASNRKHGAIPLSNG